MPALQGCTVFHPDNGLGPQCILHMTSVKQSSTTTSMGAYLDAAECDRCLAGQAARWLNNGLQAQQPLAFSVPAAACKHAVAKLHILRCAASCKPGPPTCCSMGHAGIICVASANPQFAPPVLLRKNSASRQVSAGCVVAVPVKSCTVQAFLTSCSGSSAVFWKVRE